MLGHIVISWPHTTASECRIACWLTSPISCQHTSQQRPDLDIFCLVACFQGIRWHTPPVTNMGTLNAFMNSTAFRWPSSDRLKQPRRSLASESAPACIFRVVGLLGESGVEKSTPEA